jgi:hypothetical protein
LPFSAFYGVHAQVQGDLARPEVIARNSATIDLPVVAESPLSRGKGW